MKIRTGFISNSSSSSFCVYGISLRLFDYKNRLRTYMNFSNSDEDEGKLSDLIYSFWDNDTLICDAYDENNDTYYIGRSYNTIGGNETGDEFKQKTEEILKPLLGNDIKFSFINEVIYG